MSALPRPVPPVQEWTRGALRARPEPCLRPWRGPFSPGADLGAPPFPEIGPHTGGQRDPFLVCACLVRQGPLKPAFWREGGANGHGARNSF